jgi:electron-transferring-flavoprotein dehydrogenase
MEREVLTTDVLFVGAGPANLTAAYVLAKKLAAAGKAGDVQIMVIEKGKSVGDHILSGAVMDPRAMAEAWGADWRTRGCPVEADVVEEQVFKFTATAAKPLPFIPPTLKNHGNAIVALSNVAVWMKQECEALGVMIAEGYPAAEPVLEGSRVVGVRLVDQGREADGSAGGSFTPGAEIRAKIVVLGEGTRGSVAKIVVEKLGLAGPNPQVFGAGVKELWDIPAGRIKRGTVYHSAGWPLPPSTYGGSWIYAQSDTRVSIGFVSALDGGDPAHDPYETMQTWKTHPFVRALLDGGTLVKGGTKTVPEGGWWSRPKSYGDGFLIVGDSASLLNIARLKGIHSAIHSGMLAGETAFAALESGNTDAASLKPYADRLEASWLGEELRRVRNWRQAFQKGFALGSVHAGLMWALGGKIFTDRLPIHSDAAAMRRGSAALGRTFKADGKLTFDKLTGVYQAGSIHEEHQPSHLVIADTDVCATKCRTEYGNPCERFCPASVYEMIDAAGGGKAMKINFSNCVHCKTCDVADPYGVITWTVPQDAGGPKYLGL